MHLLVFKVKFRAITFVIIRTSHNYHAKFAYTLPLPLLQNLLKIEMENLNILCHAIIHIRYKWMDGKLYSFAVTYLGG